MGCCQASKTAFRSHCARPTGRYILTYLLAGLRGSSLTTKPGDPGNILARLCLAPCCARSARRGSEAAAPQGARGKPLLEGDRLIRFNRIVTVASRALFHLTRCLRTLRARLQSSHLWWPRAARAKGSG